MMALHDRWILRRRCPRLGPLDGSTPEGRAGERHRRILFMAGSAITASYLHGGAGEGIDSTARALTRSQNDPLDADVTNSPPVQTG
jgi:hypothetical protein